MCSLAHPDRAFAKHLGAERVAGHDDPHGPAAAVRPDRDDEQPAGPMHAAGNRSVHDRPAGAIVRGDAAGLEDERHGLPARMRPRHEPKRGERRDACQRSTTRGGNEMNAHAGEQRKYEAGRRETRRAAQRDPLRRSRRRKTVGLVVQVAMARAIRRA